MKAFAGRCRGSLLWSLLALPALLLVAACSSKSASEPQKTEPAPQKRPDVRPPGSGGVSRRPRYRRQGGRESETPAIG